MDGFSVSLSAPYLGAAVGPQSGLHFWSTPITKFHERIGALARSGAPSRVVGQLYESRAVSVLSYLAQLALLPPSAHTA